MIKAVLTKPLDGLPEGTEREFDEPDFETLQKMGAVRRAAADGPEKAAPTALNKKAPPVANKAVKV